MSGLRVVTVILSLIVNNAMAEGDVWRPSPKFSVEGAPYIETLTFISGIAYALTYSKKELSKHGLSNFYCLSKNDEVTSRLLIDIVNDELQGDQTSEAIISVIMNGLSNKYPCEK